MKSQICRVRQLSVCEMPLRSSMCPKGSGTEEQCDDDQPNASRFVTATPFRHLFTQALKHAGIVCMGLYRRMDLEDFRCGSKRYVITFPPADFQVLPCDLVRKYIT